MKQGSMQADGIALGELSATFIGASPSMKAKAAFVDTRSGATHGWTHNEVWSKEVLQRLQDLKDAVEADLAAIHFTSHVSSAISTTIAGSGGESSPTTHGGGLAEHIGDDTKLPSI